MGSDEPAAILAGWREAEQAAAKGPWKPAYRTWTEATDERCAEARIHDCDGSPVAITYLSGLLEPDEAGETEQFIVTARAAMPRLVAAVEAVLKRHVPVKKLTRLGPPPFTKCADCDQIWPCSTYEAITAALTGEDAGDEH